MPDVILSAIQACVGSGETDVVVVDFIRLSPDRYAVAFNASNTPFGAVYLRREESKWGCKDIEAGPPSTGHPFSSVFLAQLSLDTDGGDVVPLVLGNAVDEVTVVNPHGVVVDHSRPISGLALVQGSASDQIRGFSNEQLVVATSIVPADLEVMAIESPTSHDEARIAVFLEKLLHSEGDEVTRFVDPSVPASDFIANLRSVLSVDGQVTFGELHPTFYGFDVPVVDGEIGWNLLLVLSRVEGEARLASYELRRTTEL